DYSKIYVDTSSNATVPFTLSREPDYYLKDSVAVYRLDGMFHLSALAPKPKVPVSELRPLLYTDRFITGFGQEYGGLVTR
ncbi:hypothetical protein NL478_27920, partial [Klebsiella pneumoniae]|nr:hypothetical protein [Klebsiella pneumoniae]